MAARQKEPEVTASVEEQNPAEAPETSTQYLVDEPWAVDLTGHEDTTTAALWAKVKDREPGVWAARAELEKYQPPTKAEIEDILQNDERPEIAEYREKITALRAQLDEADNAAYEFILSGIETLPKEEYETKVNDFRRDVAALKAVVGITESMSKTLGHDDVADLVAQYVVPQVPRGSGAAPRPTGTGGSRPQVKAIKVFNESGELLKSLTEDKAKLSFAAQYVKSETPVLQAAWLEASGMGTWQEIKDVVTFQVGNFSFEVTPKG